MSEVAVVIMDPDKIEEIRRILTTKGCVIECIGSFIPNKEFKKFSMTIIGAKCKSEEVSNEVLKELKKIYSD